MKKPSYSGWLRDWKRKGALKWPEALVMVVVRWTDATYSQDEHGTAALITTGFLFDATAEHLVLAGEVCPEDTGTRDHTTIPASIVTHIASHTFVS